MVEENNTLEAARNVLLDLFTNISKGSAEGCKLNYLYYLEDFGLIKLTPSIEISSQFYKHAIEQTIKGIPISILPKLS